MKNKAAHPCRQSFHKKSRFHHYHVSPGYAIPLFTSFVLLSTAFRFFILCFFWLSTTIAIFRFQPTSLKEDRTFHHGKNATGVWLDNLVCLFQETFIFSASNHYFTKVKLATYRLDLYIFEFGISTLNQAKS